tara:strand:+ start:14 stop:241 length:228 start_codon:yes stop_codon:yes gene_type:complete
MKDLKVEKIKKGDVLFFLQNKIELLETIIRRDEEAEVKWRLRDNQMLQEWYNGRITARKFDLEILQGLTVLINKL